MKKIISILLAAVMVMALLAGCGSKNSDKTNDNNTPNNNQDTELSGSVSTNGSTSMDKVIGALREQFMADHKNVTVTYDPTGIISGMSDAAVGSLYQQALFSIGLVLFLFIMLINVLLNVCIKRKKED